MSLYLLMKEYALSRKVSPDPESLTPELGRSLSLFHSCLVESGMQNESAEDFPRVTASPEKINPTHLSHFIIGFLPFNGVTAKEEVNNVLFDLYSFLHWMKKKEIPHGLACIDFKKLVGELSSSQERCLKLSHLLDNETGRVLADGPDIVDTLNDLFSVIKIEGPFLLLQGSQLTEPVRLRLPEPILGLVHLNDHLDLVLGETSEQWVVLEAGQVFPAYEVSDNPPSN